MSPISDRLQDIANQFVYSYNVKQAARLRKLCSLKEWELVLVEAKKIHAQRKA